MIDHGAVHGLHNLVSLIGVRYTMARADAARAVNLVCMKLEQAFGRSRTAEVAVQGAGFERFESLVDAVSRRLAGRVGREAAAALAHNYGTEYRRVLEIGEEPAVGEGCLTGTTTFRAEIAHAIREEMAVRLADVVFRRTDLATGGHPGPAALQEAAAIAARELHWDDRRRRDEVAEVERRFIVGNGAGFAPPERMSSERPEALAGASA